MRMRRRNRSLFVQDGLRAALLLIAGAVIWSCSKDATYEADTSTPAPAECSVTDGDIGKWIEHPSMPTAPADGCFFNFAWQELFAVTQRAEGGAPRFATWPDDQKLFAASGDPRPWAAGPRRMLGRPLRKGLGMPGTGGVVADQVTEAAALTPLVDQEGRFAHFSVVVNQPEYEYVRCCELYKGACFNRRGGVDLDPPVSQIKLPDGSLELKLAWRVLDKEDTSRYLTVEGEVQVFSPDDPSTAVKTTPATLGLVGMHIVHWTKGHPGALWATFEHIDNAPDCGPDGGPPVSPTPPPGFAGWHFYKADCDPKNPYCEPNSYCPPCEVTVPQDVVEVFNANTKHTWKIPDDGVITCTPLPHEFNQPVGMPDGTKYWIHLFDPKTCKKPPIPTQACRRTPISTDVKALNDQVRKVLAGPPGSNAGIAGNPAVLANYELVGVEWFASAEDEQQNMPQGQPIDTISQQVSLSNATMETFLQDPKVMGTGCVACHTNQGSAGSVNPVPSAPPMAFNSGLAGRSMIFQQIRQFSADCSDQPPAKCEQWKDVCPAKM